MKPPEHAKRDRALLQARKIMARVASQRGTISYGDLAGEIEVMSLAPNGKLLEGILTQISRREDAQERGLLSIVVVNKADGMPGDGFFALARDRGYQFDSDEEFFRDHLEVVYGHHTAGTS